MLKSPIKALAEFYALGLFKNSKTTALQVGELIIMNIEQLPIVLTSYLAYISSFCVLLARFNHSGPSPHHGAVVSIFVQKMQFSFDEPSL